MESEWERWLKGKIRIGLVSQRWQVMKDMNTSRSFAMLISCGLDLGWPVGIVSPVVYSLSHKVQPLVQGPHL